MPESTVLEIIAPGLQTTVQDLGRHGYGCYGVAPSGALDTLALRVANLLVGNSENAAGLETLLLGLRVRALRRIVVAVTGGDLQPFIDRNPCAMWSAQVLEKGQELAFKGPRSGFRAYIAFSGGLSVPTVMASRATNLPAGFGGMAGRALRANDILRAVHTGPGLTASDRCLDPEDIPIYPEKSILRILWGPQEDHFTVAGRKALVESSFVVSPQSDRTGLRLSGPQIERRADVAESIISEGVIVGAIQIPGGGQPIVILNETVTGGYRKIATVISADLPLLGQIKPGDSVSFRAVSLAAADAALREMEAKIDRLRESLS